jgi:hypothetical protein
MKKLGRASPLAHIDPHRLKTCATNAFSGQVKKRWSVTTLHKLIFVMVDFTGSWKLFLGQDWKDDLRP